MLEEIYRRHVAAKTAISAHLPRLRELASHFETVVEFGVKRGASSSALLLGADRVTSFDIVETPEARGLKNLVGERWDYRIEDSRKANVPDAQMFFIDSLHAYAQVRDELALVGPSARVIALHDVSTFGEVGALAETGRQSWTYVAGKGSVPEGHWGIRPAIDEFMMADHSWYIIERRVESHGLLVLARH